MATAQAFPESDVTGAARQCLWFFVGMLLVSLGYILVTATFNGDFYGVPVRLGAWDLALMSCASVAPYLLGYWIYRHYAKNAPWPTVEVTSRRLCRTFFILIIWFIFLAIKYDVGVLERGIYDAPALLKPIIQISNRINPFYLGVFFIASYQGPRKVLVLGTLLLISLGLARASLGIFLYVLLALIIRNHRQIGRFFRKHFLILVMLTVVLPAAVSELYALRTSLRGKEESGLTLSPVEIITARLVGRMSSISNSAFVLQERRQFSSDVKALDTLYYQKQALSLLVGIGVVPDAIPERLLINVNGGSAVDVSFMTGVPGNFLMAWLLHPAIAIFNTLTMILMIWLSFHFGNKLGLAYRHEVVFMLLLYPLTSGVSNEFAGVAVTMVALVILFKLVNIPLIRQSIR